MPAPVIHCPKLVFNGKVQERTLHGRKYLVVPSTILVTGVLNGSVGPLLYTEEEVGKDPSIWNGMPVVLNHPFNDAGEPASARDPEVLEEVGIGVLYNCRFESGKLLADVWLDEAKTLTVDATIIDNIKNGTVLECSTGLVAEIFPAAEGAVHNSTAYTHVATNFKPDHLAILPSAIGACSIADGCGILVNTKTPSTNFHITNASGLSFQQIHESLTSLLREKYQATTPPLNTYDDPVHRVWIADVFEDTFVYHMGEDLYEHKYSITSGKVKLSTVEPKKLYAKSATK